ncbi:MAG: hypothetical protein ACYDHZ_00685 [Dehalococcoidia bacterium]
MSGAAIRSTYNAVVETELNRVTQIPTAAVGFNLVSDGAAVAGAYMAANVQIVAAGVVPVIAHLMGITLGLPAVEAFQADIQIAILGAPETTIVTIGCGTNVFPSVEWFFPYIPFGLDGIKLIGQPRISYNIRKTTGASAAGFLACHLVIRTNVGS